MFVLNATSGNSANFEKMKLDNSMTVQMAHTLSFHCNSENSSITENDGEHVIYDCCGRKKYEIQLVGPKNGKTKNHALINKYGQRLGSLTAKNGTRVFPMEIDTTTGIKNGSYHPHIYRDSKATIELEGKLYSIIKTKHASQKVYYWVAKGTIEPLAQMSGGFGAHDFVFYPNCPEALEKAIMLVRSYACYISGLYDN